MRLNILSSEGGNSEDTYTSPEHQGLFSNHKGPNQPVTFMNTKKIISGKEGKHFYSYEQTTPSEEEEARQSTRMEGEMPMRMTMQKANLSVNNASNPKNQFYYLPTDEEEGEEDQISSVSQVTYTNRANNREYFTA
jgi:hypothetical protein